MVLNPNEIANHKFDKVMGRGYRVDEVENYLRQIADEMDRLIEEKRELEQKMLVLADKLEEYKHDEESLRAALLGAQKLGDSVIRDAKSKAETIVSEANARASMMVENAKRAIEREQHGYIRMQREVATFRTKLQFLYKQHLEMISSIPVDEDLMEVAMGTSAKPQSVAQPAPQEEPSLLEEETAAVLSEEQTVPETPQDAEEETALADISTDLPEVDYEQPSLEYEETYLPEPEDMPPAELRMPDPDPTPAKRESRFGPLRFGKDFDIKREDGKRRR